MAYSFNIACSCIFFFPVNMLHQFNVISSTCKQCAPNGARCEEYKEKEKGEYCDVTAQLNFKYTLHVLSCIMMDYM